MFLTVLGINHRTAPVELRGQITFPPEQIDAALADLCSLDGVQEAVILSTCNRTEVYCVSPEDNVSIVSDWLCNYRKIDPRLLKPHLYSYHNAETVRHLLRVAAGLDSVILGEPQILGQLKAAYQQAASQKWINTHINRLFQNTFAVAKQIRTDTAIGASPVSVAFAAVSLARQIFGDLKDNTALLIGAGETIELTARHLHEHGIGQIIVANRTVDRAHELAARFNGYGISLDEILTPLATADLVISSTGSPQILVNKEMMRSALAGHKRRPVLMIDIAVPGDIAPDVGELEDIYLYTVDDLEEVIQENLASRQQAARQAEEIIEVQVERFMAWTRSLNAVPSIQTYRKHADNIGEQEVAKARQMLASGKDPGDVIETLAHNIVNKLAHEPSVNLRQAAADGQSGLLETVRTLFRLKDNSEN